MPERTIVYSCLVDEGPVFDRQCRIWVLSLLRRAHVDPSRIVVNLIGEHSALQTFLHRYSVKYFHTQKFGDGKYCNKLSQFNTTFLLSADYVFLTDCDIFFVNPLDEFANDNDVRGIVVDMPNPPIEDLEKIYSFYDIPLPPRIPCLTTQMTLSGNFNGGLYGIPKKYFLQLGRIWRLFALDMLSTQEIQEILGAYRKHVDQISFALAVAKMRTPLTLLPPECNLPLHIFRLLEESQRTDYARHNRTIFALHYHDLLSPQGKLLEVGIDCLDREIRSMNDIIKKEIRESDIRENDIREKKTF